ncbi:hypothetical protein OO015_06770 [Thermomicrobium sp. 4228-Ro]|uniref:hypothetical protein n=1 Tax=Thermomicrobium sp. 4228-Ro TaxID=2993937 RepID=UPI0022493B82|nr:hypothetical protein [Thermomicrobium sp. 4228-Ro]MCX2727198.1 hypothetical protein [Thermomicrobium sp. 4228-Ro]
MTPVNKVPSLHEHGLPLEVHWDRIAETVRHCLQLDAPFPPEQLWVIAPDGGLRGHYRGDDSSVRVPFHELGKLYQAVFLHTHPPRFGPNVSDLYLAAIASSPLLAVIAGDQAHLVFVWHRSAPGLVGAQIAAAGELRPALEAVGGRWLQCPTSEITNAIRRDVAGLWEAFVRALAW